MVDLTKKTTMKVLPLLFFSILCLLLAVFSYAEDDQILITQKTAEIENCLVICYHIDHDSAMTIIPRFYPLLNSVEYHSVLDDFIKSSMVLAYCFENPFPSKLLPNDAVIKASDWHEVLLESPYIRVLYGYSKPGDFEPFHTHQWRHLMLILTEARFKMESANGMIEIDTFPIGVYDLPPEETPMAYTNIGTTDFRALIFEVKE